MKIAIISDTHDNTEKLKLALQAAGKAHAEAVIHAGDFVAPFALEPLSKCGLPVHAVLGNNDGERDGLRRAFALMGAHFWEGPVQFSLGDTVINLQHLPYTASEMAAHMASASTPKTAAVHTVPSKNLLARDLMNSQPRRILICGHTHKPKIEKIKNMLIINPGECCGWLTGKSTFVMCDTAEHSAELIEIS